MKKYILGLAVSALAITSVSCDDFLNTQPEGQPTTGTYFTNDQQAIDAVEILYADVQQEGCFGREFFWEQAAANDVVWGRTRSYPALATFNYSGDESPLRSVWERLTRIMRKCSHFGMRNSNLSVYFSGENLFTITNYSGMDPECGGWDALKYPVSKVYSFGVKLTY